MSRDIETLIDTLSTIRDTGSPPNGDKAIRTLASGQKIADTFPLSMSDKNGPQKEWKVEVWMQGGKEASQGKFYSKERHARGWTTTLHFTPTLLLGEPFWGDGTWQGAPEAAPQLLTMLFL